MGGSKPGSSTSQSASQPPQEFLNAYSNLINSATALTKQPLQQYSGPMVAGFTPQQQQGFQEIQNSQGLAQPYINTAATLAGEAGSPVTGQQISQYESPYNKDVIKATRAQFNNTNEQNAAQAKANQIGSGAYGGDRAGIAQAALTGQEQTAQNPVIAGLYNQNFMQAENEANLQHQNELSSSFQFGNLGNEAQNSALTGAAAELQAGGQQQQLAQEQMNIPYEQFMQQQMFPYQQLGWLGNLTEGLGSLSGGSGTSTTNQAGSGIMGLFGFDKGGKVRDGFSNGGGLDPMIEYTEIAGENRKGYDDGGSISQSPYMMYSEIAGENANRGGFSPGQLPAVPDPAVDIIPPSTGGGTRGPGPPGAPSSAVQQSSSGSGSMSPMQGLQMGQQMAGMFSGPSAGAGSVGGLSGGLTDFTGGSALTEASGGLGGLSGLGASGAAAGGADAAGSAAAGSSLADLWPMLLALFHDGGRVGFSRGGYGGGGGAVRNVSAPGGGFSYPQVSSSLFSGPSKTDPVTGGLPGSFNPLAQWKPPGTGPNNELPHYTMPVNPAFDYLGPVGPAGGGLNGISYGGSGPGYWRGMTPPAPYAEGGRLHYDGGGPVDENGGTPDVNVDGQPATSGFSPPGDRAATPAETPGSFKAQPGMLYAPHAVQGRPPVEHSLLNPILTGLFTALGSNSRSSLGAMGEGALAGLKSDQAQTEYDNKPIVDHSGRTIMLHYNTGPDWDTGIVTEGYANSQATQQTRRDALAENAQNRADTLSEKQQEFGATQQYRLADINVKREAAGEPPIASLDAANAGAAAPGQGGDVYTQFANKMGSLENTTGNRAAANASGPNGTPTSSAVGDDQFTQRTWLNTVREARPELASYSDQQLLQLRKDPAFSTEMTAELAKHNGAELSQAGQPVTMESLALAHRFGSQGALAVLNATPDTPMAKLLSPKAIQANPTLANQTAGQYVRTLNQQLGPTQTAQVNPAAFGKFDKPQTVEVKNPDGTTQQVMAQQNQRNGQWVSADQNRTPINGVTRVVSPQEQQQNFSVTPPGNPKLHGDQYLASIPNQATAGEVKAIVQGRMAQPTSFFLKTPQGQQLMAAAAQYEPGFDLSLYQSRVAAQTDLAKGKMGQNVTSFNTAIGHAGRLDSHIDALGNSGILPYITNNIHQGVMAQYSPEMQTAISNFQTDKNALVAELTRAFRGTGGNVHDLDNWEKELSQSASPASLHAAVREGMGLLQSRIEAFNDQYSRAMRIKSNPGDLLSPNARATLAKLSGSQNGDGGGPIRVANDNDYAKLASGTRFISPDGKTRIKP